MTISIMLMFFILLAINVIQLGVNYFLQDNIERLYKKFNALEKLVLEHKRIDNIKV